MLGKNWICMNIRDLPVEPLAKIHFFVNPLNNNEDDAKEKIDSKTRLIIHDFLVDAILKKISKKQRTLRKKLSTKSPLSDLVQSQLKIKNNIEQLESILHKNLTSPTLIELTLIKDEAEKIDSNLALRQNNRYVE